MGRRSHPLALAGSGLSAAPWRTPNEGREMRIPACLWACLLCLYAHDVHACSPPVPVGFIAGPADTDIPDISDQVYAYIGKVVGYSKNEWDDPSLDIEVLDAWTPKQKKGDVLKVTVQPWSGCHLPRERGGFDPREYPVGTRLRIVSPGNVIPSSDVESALVVVGVAP